MFFRSVLILTILTVSSAVSAQHTASIKLVDKVTGEPLPFAHLCFENKTSGIETFQVTDTHGKANQEIKGPTTVAISMMGYKTLLDTLSGGGSYTYKLEPTVFDMDEVVVTAQIKPKKADNSIYKVNVINNLKIKEKAANNLSDLLSGELNFRITQDAALGSGLTLNGLKGEHVKILIDGVPVIGRMNGNIDLGQLNLNNVDHIEVIEGPMSVQYGSNALAGAINIITRENTRNKVTAGVQTYFESVGVYNADATVSLNRKKHSVSLNGGRNFFGGYPRTEGIRTSLFKPKEQYFGDLYYLYHSADTRLKADVRLFRETILWKGTPGAIGYGRALDSYFYTNRGTGKLFFGQKTGEHSRLDIVAAFAAYNRTKETYVNDLTRLEKTLSPNNSLQDTTSFGDYISRGTWSFDGPSGWFGLQAGYDINVENGTGKRILNNKQQIGDYALFTTMNFILSPKFEFQTGFRYAYNTKYDAPFVPSLNLKYSLNKKLSLRASYVRGFRAPSLKELYLEFVDINHNILPSPDLKAENSHNINLSGNYKFDIGKSFFDFELNGFYNQIENSIQLTIVDPARETPVYGYVNVDGYRTSGGSLKLSYRLHPRFEVSLGESAINHYYYYTGENGRAEDDAMSYEFTANMKYNLFKSDFVLSAFYKYTGKYPQLAEMGDDIHFATIDAYHTMDITLNKSFLARRLTIGTGVKNLFNVTNVFSGGASAEPHGGAGGSTPVSWGRTYFVRLAYNFAKY